MKVVVVKPKFFLYPSDFALCMLEKNHPYFVGVQFHPEYISRPLKPSPPYLGLVLASCGRLSNFLVRGCRMSPRHASDMDSTSEDEMVHVPSTGERKASEGSAHSTNPSKDASEALAPGSLEHSRLVHVQSPPASLDGHQSQYHKGHHDSPPRPSPQLLNGKSFPETSPEEVGADLVRLQLSHSDTSKGGQSDS
ncbi:hypothetical protein HPB47_019246 [Ixodes persulcatus]|uniref:Uncharacterized protein n=1 Tax=Ixodes persulcatus TaxID=34615 RepID=A0AC60R0H8_IXOPE|nr:hypothetical protein HPB47_019246 [Ixodes persulcatus]